MRSRVSYPPRSAFASWASTIAVQMNSCYAVAPLARASRRLLGAIWLVALAPPIQASAQEAVAPFPRAVLVQQTEASEVAPREFIVSPVEKIRRELSIERKLRIEASASSITWRIPDGTPLTEVMEHYREALGPDPLFVCQGRDCGRSNGWANQVFQQAILYGPDANQFYIASDRGAELVSVYLIERGNRRIYAHLEVLRPERSVRVAINAELSERLAGEGVAIIEGVRPRRDGSIAEAEQTLLRQLGSRLATFERSTIYVVCHLYGSEPVPTLLERALACAGTARDLLGEALADNTNAPTLEPFAAGPLLPRADAASARLELLLPHRQQRD